MNKETIYKDIESIITEIDIVAAKIEDEMYRVQEVHNKIDDLNCTVEEHELGKNFMDFVFEFKINVLREYADEKGICYVISQVRILADKIHTYKKTLKKGGKLQLEIETIYWTLREVYDELDFSEDDDIYDVDDLIKLLNDIKEKLRDLIE